MSSNTLNICQCGFANKHSATTCVACGSKLAPSKQDTANVSTQTSARADTITESRQMLQLILTNVASTGAYSESDVPATQVVIEPPGGIIGRAGDFSPEIFSARVSGIHAKLTCEDKLWSIEFLGRNKSYILRAGKWFHPENSTPVILNEGDQLRLADMLFKVSMNSVGTNNKAESDANNASDSHRSTTSPESSDTIDTIDTSHRATSPNTGYSTTPADTGGLNNNATSETASKTSYEAWVITCPICGQRYEVEGSTSRIAKCSICIDTIDKRAIASIAPKLQLLQSSEQPLQSSDQLPHIS